MLDYTHSGQIEWASHRGRSRVLSGSSQAYRGLPGAGGRVGRRRIGGLRLVHAVRGIATQRVAHEFDPVVHNQHDALNSFDAPDSGTNVRPVPESARQQTNDGALAFATFWVNQANKAYQKPVLGAIARFCLPESSSCNDLEKPLRAMLEQRLHADRPLMSASSSWIGVPEEPGGTSVMLDVYLQAYNVVDEGGVTRTTDAAAHVPMTLNLLWRNDSWFISSVKAMVLR